MSNELLTQKLRGWISVKERLPEMGDMVLAFTPSSTWLHNRFKAYCYSAANKVWKGGRITYWMPLQPPVPTDADSEQGADPAVVEELVKAIDDAEVSYQATHDQDPTRYAVVNLGDWKRIEDAKAKLTNKEGND